MKINRDTAVPKLSALIAAAALVVPAGASAKAVGSVDRDAGATNKAAPKVSGLEKDYLKLRERFVDEFGLQAAGRNIVRWGELDKQDEVRPATDAEVKESIATMKDGFVEPETSKTETSSASTDTTETTETEDAGSYDTAGAPTSVIECESGGDYGTDTGNGYYGAYQFDQGTWDANAPEGYAGTNPASAPPEVQDATAAAVPYDAWPNC